MYTVVILPKAKDDIRQAALWYNEKQPGLGKRFVFQIRQKVEHIRQHPMAFSKRYEDVRLAVMNIFPFTIHYSVDDRVKTVLIIAVMHTSRDPKNWDRRIKE
ncbi:type II toxin-antitoxin system RelE/ParE family toxin [Williamwhitmania taraxaci]|uniref:Plasmid stabilization system protein ParE n=1 Tax=Williamwhitmania taraxaci TaxID=1640674 RepID=A0A1G6GU81_9BACT|nr:type II toxin-antitoxin system RelE/ParE family toxin [Williamwhitmania taraxaci]SDB85567.1 Plasmid stabilization system protein ParE [Williamwhitmania taraxaci]